MNIVEQWANIGAEYVGAQVLIRVGDLEPTTLGEVRNCLLSHPNVPDEWAPEQESDLSLYLNTINSLGRTRSFKKFKGNLGIPAKEHGGYEVIRLFKASHDDVPTSHKVVHVRKTVVDITDEYGNVVAKRTKNVKFDDGIRIDLKRTSGTHETDSTGGSDWKLRIVYNDQLCDIQNIPQVYLPFIHTLSDNFHEKRNKIYASKEVRDIVNDIVLSPDKLGAENLANLRGVYFIPPSKLQTAQAVNEALQGLDGEVTIHLQDVVNLSPLGMESNTYTMVSDALGETILNELESFVFELQELAQSEAETRPSTWVKRMDHLRNVKERVEEYHDLKLVNQNLMKELYEKSLKFIQKQMMEA